MFRQDALLWAKVWDQEIVVSEELLLAVSVSEASSARSEGIWAAEAYGFAVSVSSGDVGCW